MPCSVINYTMQHITFSVLFYNWKFVPFDYLHPFHLILIHIASGNHQCVLCIYKFGGFCCVCVVFSFFNVLSSILSERVALGVWDKWLGRCQEHLDFG